MRKVKKKLSLAPVVIFACYRVSHFRKCIEALSKNPEAKHTTLHVFIDKPPPNKGLNADKLQSDLREICAVNQRHFDKILTVEREKNIGLASNITTGIDEVLRNNDRVIVLEDDIIVSKQFLEFMNLCLEAYKNKSHIWHIAAWSYMNSHSEIISGVITKRMSCWGWATWGDRWASFDMSPKIEQVSFGVLEKFKFNFYGFENFFSQIEANLNHSKKTWAIFWYLAIFKSGGLCVQPSQSLVENIGFDGSGENCEASNSGHKIRSGCSIMVDENLASILNFKQIVLFVIYRLKTKANAVLAKI